MVKKQVEVKYRFCGLDTTGIKTVVWENENVHELKSILFLQHLHTKQKQKFVIESCWLKESRNGAVVRTFEYHQYGPGLIPKLALIYCLRSRPCPRAFSLAIPVPFLPDNFQHSSLQFNLKKVDGTANS